ncbi:hypothetical protein [Methylobacterium bullatum]|uniref:Uncharacterized protein n=1 Tax=Methylobacterium bullatum TaxID=570505 RepID=A0A679JER8_9HYPH|nr:hypothetical protein MBLL_00586 [Methylobacterium bullatum]
MNCRKAASFMGLALIGFLSIFAVGEPQANELRTSGIYKLNCGNGDFAWGDDDGPPMNVKAIDRYGTSMMLESTKGYNEWWRVCRGVVEKRKLQSAEGQGGRSGWVPIERLKKSLDNLTKNYGDIKSAAQCQKPASKVDMIICDNGYLRTAEILHTRASAYMEENGTKREVNHLKFAGALPKKCTTEQCVYDFFKDGTNDALGGTSPYEQK